MATKKLDPEMTCRGRWSVCGGKNPSRSAAWHICQECTDTRATVMKAAAGKKAKAALVTPTEEKKADTATGSKAISKALEAQRREAVRYAPLASDRR